MIYFDRKCNAVLIVAARNKPRVYFNEIHNKVTFFLFLRVLFIKNQSFIF